MLERVASNAFRGCRKTIEAALVDTFFCFVASMKGPQSFSTASTPKLSRRQTAKRVDGRLQRIVGRRYRAISFASSTACAQSFGRSCGKLCPAPPNTLCSCQLLNFSA